MPIRRRLTMVFTGVLALVIAAAGITLSITLDHQLRSSVDNGLLSRAEVIASAYQEGARRLLGAGSLIEPDEHFAQIIDPEGEVLQHSSGVDDEPLLVPPLVREVDGYTFYTVELELDNELQPARLLVLGLDETHTLIAGASLEDQAEAIAAVRAGLLVGGPVLVALGAALFWAVVTAALRPVEKLRQEADAIALSAESRQLTVPDSGDEIAQLAESLNAMLDRLAQALQRERRFVDAASHELRTPVARLMAELELALGSEGSSEELRRGIAAALDDAADLGRLTQDLLVFVRSEPGALPVRAEEVELAEVVEHAITSLQGSLERSGATVHRRIDGRWRLDPLRLRQVLTNLLDNCIRHGGDRLTITITAEPVDGVLLLVIEDDGHGFPESVLARSQRPSERAGERMGLGIPIVETIVKAHGGRMRLSNRPDGGARVTLTFA